MDSRVAVQVAVGKGVNVEAGVAVEGIPVGVGAGPEPVVMTK